MQTISLLISKSTILPIAIGVVVSIGVIALIVGWVKGFSRIGWSAFLLAGAAGFYCLFEKFLHDKNPILKIGAIASKDIRIQNFVSSASLLLAAAFCAVFVYGLLSLLFRPKRKKKNSYEDVDEDDIELMDIDEDEKIKHEKKHGKPHIGIFNRLIGALVAAVSAMFALAVIAGYVLVALRASPLYDGLQSVYEQNFIAKIFPAWRAHALDFLFVGIVASICYGQYRVGLLGGIRGFICTFGYLAAIVAAFVLPFMDVGPIASLNSYFAGLTNESVDPARALLIGRIASGVVLCVALCLLVALIGWILEMLSKFMQSFFLLRLIDGGICVIFVMTVGLVLCLGIGVLLYLLEYFKLMGSSNLFTENSWFVKNMFEAFDALIGEKLDAIFGGVI